MYNAPEYFPSIHSHARLNELDRLLILVPQELLLKGLLPGVDLSVYFPGFPTLQHVPHTAKLATAKVWTIDEIIVTEKSLFGFKLQLAYYL